MNKVKKMGHIMKLIDNRLIMDFLLQEVLRVWYRKRKTKLLLKTEKRS